MGATWCLGYKLRRPARPELLRHPARGPRLARRLKLTNIHIAPPSAGDNRRDAQWQHHRHTTSPTPRPPIAALAHRPTQKHAFSERSGSGFGREDAREFRRPVLGGSLDEVDARCEGGASPRDRVPAAECVCAPAEREFVEQCAYWRWEGGV